MDRNASREAVEGETEEASNAGGSAKEKGKGRGRPAMVIEVAPLKLTQFQLTLVGETPLIMNNFNQRGQGLADMRDRMLGVPAPKKGNRPPKDPLRAFRDSLYSHDEPKVKGTLKGFLAGKKVTATGSFYVLFSMLKGSIETAATDVDGASKAGVRRAVRVIEYTPKLIHKAPPYMVEHVTRLPTGAPDLRYRARFDDWAVTFTVQVNSAVLSFERVVNLFNTAGFTSGLGDWRPEHGGEFGRFHVKGGSAHTRPTK